jgi:hypothetical protein
VQQHQQLGEELMAARVQGESSGGKVSALEAQLRELQLVSEKKLMSVAQEAEAKQHHLELELQQERSALQVRTTGVGTRVPWAMGAHAVGLARHW